MASDDVMARIVRLEERQVADRRALKLQAAEYGRRLDDLNHAHEQAREVQNTYVTTEKYEDKIAAEAEARDTALLRVDEKFNAALVRVDERFADHVKRWELRQREIDQALAVQSGAAEEATKQIDRQTRITNRNIAIAVLAISAVSVTANYFGAI